jgi:hydroxymethylpyrimidine/phosphomethylpyrimidine kinase
MFSLSKREYHFFISCFFISFAQGMNKNKPILTITGSDSTGGSGVQADIRMISALGCFAVSAITSITVQNTLGIQEFFDIPSNIVLGQIEAIINDIEPSIVKIGMIRSVGVLNAICDALTKYKTKQIIYDPIVYSSKGEELMTEEVVAQIKHQLLPLCSLVIIRKADAEYILNTKINSIDDKYMAIERLKNYGSSQVLLLDECINTFNIHGESNSMSSAIAAYLSKGEPYDKAISLAKSYINQQIVRSTDLTGRASELYTDFIDCVATKYRTNSDVKYYADSLNVSSRYLAQVCKQISGNAPKTIIDDYLMKELEVQLRTTDKTIQEIAYEFGFSSQAHFTKFFKKLKHITPSEFRKTK